MKVFRCANEDLAELRRCPHHIGEDVQRARVFAEVIEKHRAAAATGDVARNGGHRPIRIRRFEHGRQQVGGEPPQRLARHEIVGHLLKLAVDGRGIAEAQRPKVRAGLILGEVGRQEEI